MFQPRPMSQKTAWLCSILVLFVVASGVVGYRLRTQADSVPTTAEVTLPAVETTEPATEAVPVQEVVAQEQLLIDEAPFVSQDVDPAPMPEVSTPTSVDVASFLEEAAPVVYPLDGEIISVFSVSELTYNETMGDWRIHDGVDIAAAQGTSVVSACAGTVIAVDDTDLMGTQVVIDHHNGYQTTYANLQVNPLAATGDSVESGQAIGAVGTTALADSALEPHLHFSVSYNGDVIDPMAYLNPTTDDQ